MPHHASEPCEDLGQVRRQDRRVETQDALAEAPGLGPSPLAAGMVQHRAPHGIDDEVVTHARQAHVAVELAARVHVTRRRRDHLHDHRGSVHAHPLGGDVHGGPSSKDIPAFGGTGVVRTVAPPCRAPALRPCGPSRRDRADVLAILYQRAHDLTLGDSLEDDGVVLFSQRCGRGHGSCAGDRGGVVGRRRSADGPSGEGRSGGGADGRHRARARRTEPGGGGTPRGHGAPGAARRGAALQGRGSRRAPGPAEGATAAAARARGGGGACSGDPARPRSCRGRVLRLDAGRSVPLARAALRQDLQPLEHDTGAPAARLLAPEGAAPSPSARCPGARQAFKKGALPTG